MKRLLLTAFLLFGAGQISSFAQNDDIYFNSADIERQKQQDPPRSSSYSDQDAVDSEDMSYDQQGSYRSYDKSYQTDDYDNYEDDNYYASRIRRFDYPLYSAGYWNNVYSPYWYNPYYCDPYWGWSCWGRPSISIGFGYGPYWSSYWGWYSWYGYPAYYSYWYYPNYGGMYGGYYSGYWNGYYAGLYGGSNRTPINYGPRPSTNYVYNTGARPNVNRSPENNSGPRPGYRTGTSQDRPGSTDIRPGNIERSPENSRTPERPSISERPRPQEFSRDGNRPDVTPDRINTRPERYEHPGNGQRPEQINRVPQQEPVRQQRNQVQPRYQTRPQPRNEVPRQPQYQAQPQQRYEAPRQERYQPTPQYNQRSQPSAPAPRMSAPSGGGSNYGGRR